MSLRLDPQLILTFRQYVFLEHSSAMWVAAKYRYLLESHDEHSSDVLDLFIACIVGAKLKQSGGVERSVVVQED